MYNMYANQCNNTNNIEKLGERLETENVCVWQKQLGFDLHFNFLYQEPCQMR